MTVWYCIPSAAPEDEARACISAWRAMGYRIGIAADDNRMLDADLVISLGHAYPGYAASVNWLAKAALEIDPECAVVVTGGDDIWPDQDSLAGEIEVEFVEHFGGTLGVMQPTGGPAWSSREVMEGCAWSPWLGREWCERAHAGRGPLWPEFHHFFVDAALQRVAERLGLFWQRPDLAHDHRTWKREPRGKRPAHLAHAKDAWADDKALFDRLEAEGFPGSGLL